MVSYTNIRVDFLKCQVGSCPPPGRNRQSLKLHVVQGWSRCTMGYKDEKLRNAIIQKALRTESGISVLLHTWKRVQGLRRGAFACQIARDMTVSEASGAVNLAS